MVEHCLSVCQFTSSLSILLNETFSSNFQEDSMSLKLNMKTVGKQQSDIIQTTLLELSLSNLRSANFFL